MITSLLNRQGVDKTLSGVAGTSIQSAYTKPTMEPTRAAHNLSWLPYPYGPLPDTGPWSTKKETDNWENERDEKAVAEGRAPGAVGEKQDSGLMFAGGFMLVVVVISAWFLVKYMPGGYR